MRLEYTPTDRGPMAEFYPTAGFKFCPECGDECREDEMYPMKRYDYVSHSQIIERVCEFCVPKCLWSETGEHFCRKPVDPESGEFCTEHERIVATECAATEVEECNG